MHETLHNIPLYTICHKTNFLQDTCPSWGSPCHRGTSHELHSKNIFHEKCINCNTLAASVTWHNFRSHQLCLGQIYIRLIEWTHYLQALVLHSREPYLWVGIKSSLCSRAEFMYKIKNNEASLLSTENKFPSYGIGSIYTAEKSLCFLVLREPLTQCH